MSLTNFGFKVSILKMVESHRETFWLEIRHPEGSSTLSMGKQKGSMTPYKSEDIDRVRYMAHEYCNLLGVPYDEVKDPYTETNPESFSNKRIRYSLLEHILIDKEGK